MSWNTIRRIDDDAREEARKKAQERVSRKRRNAAAVRLIAEKISGKYLTKRIDQDLVSLFPSAAHVYLTQSYGNVHLSIQYRAMNYHDRDEIFLCSTENRRLDGAALLRRSDVLEQEATEIERALQSFDTVVETYNVIAARYAEVYANLKTFFHEIPEADYTLQKNYEQGMKSGKFAVGFTMTPEEFAASA